MNLILSDNCTKTGSSYIGGRIEVDLQIKEHAFDQTNHHHNQ